MSLRRPPGTVDRRTSSAAGLSLQAGRPRAEKYDQGREPHPDRYFRDGLSPPLSEQEILEGLLEARRLLSKPGSWSQTAVAVFHDGPAAPGNAIDRLLGGK